MIIIEKIQFIREPGYIYDMILVYVYKFNTTHCLANYVNSSKSIEDTEFFKSTMYEFQSVPEETSLFFHLKEHGKCFFSEYCFESNQNLLLGEYSILTIQNMLNNEDTILNALFGYYFPIILENKQFNRLQHMNDLSKMIRESDYSEELKNSLYYFLINPSDVLSKLQFSLYETHTALTRYYEKNEKQRMSLINSFDLETFICKFNQCGKYEFSKAHIDKICVSWTLINKNCIKIKSVDKGFLLILGYDYIDFIEEMISSKTPIHLHEIGTVLSEKNRVEILDYLLNNNEATMRQLEVAVNIGGTNAYYHVTMMLKANILQSRNEGKTIYYSINKRHFIDVIDFMKKYTK